MKRISIKKIPSKSNIGVKGMKHDDCPHLLMTARVITTIYECSGLQSRSIVVMTLAVIMLHEAAKLEPLTTSPTHAMLHMQQCDPYWFGGHYAKTEATL